MEAEICSDEEWEVVDYYCYNDDAKLQEESEEEEKEKWWWWWSGVGKKVVVTGVVISSAPVVIPPLLVVSALGFVMSLPFGVVFASYAATNKLMAKLLPPPPDHIPEEEYYDEGGAICNAVEIKNHIHEEGDDDDEGVAINNAVEIQNHIQEEDEEEEVVAFKNAVEIQNRIQEEEDEEEVVAINNAVEIQNCIQEEEEEEDEVVALNNAVEIQNRIQEEKEEEEDDEGVTVNNAVEIKSPTQEEEEEEEEEEEKMSSEGDDIKIDGNIETRTESVDNIDGPNAVNHLQLGPHPARSSKNDNAGFDEEKSPKSSDQKLDMPAEIKQLGTILMNDDDTPLQKHDEASNSKDAAPAKETVIIQVHHHTESTVGGPTPIKTEEIDVTTVVVAADDHSLELKEEKQNLQVNGGGLHSHHENISDEKIWEKINAIRVIVGFKAPKRNSYHEELKALYLYTGIEPPPPSASPSVADKLSFLMSVIGLK